MCTLWLQHKRLEYAFYVIHYIILLYFFFSVSYAYFFPAPFVSKHLWLFDMLGFHPLHIFNFFLYIKFAQRFLDAEQQYPYLNRQAVNLMRGIWVAFSITLIAWLLFENNSKSFLVIYMGIYIFLKLWAAWVLYIVYRQRTRDTRYIFKATVFLSGGLICIYTLIALADAGMIPENGWNFAPCIVGVLGEIYFINGGLNYKTSLQRRKLIDTQRQWIAELERNKSLLQEKEEVINNLSSQLNKEVGTTLNAIGLFTEHSLQRFEPAKKEAIEPILQRIIQDSKEMVSNMSDIVWVLSADNDNLTKTIQRIQSYTSRVCRERGIDHEFYNTCDEGFMPMNMELRKLLYTGYKELLNTFSSHISNRMIVRIGNDEKSGIQLTMEGMRAGVATNASLLLPDISAAFQLINIPSLKSNYLRLGCVFKTHPFEV